MSPAVANTLPILTKLQRNLLAPMHFRLWPAIRFPDSIKIEYSQLSPRCYSQSGRFHKNADMLSRQEMRPRWWPDNIERLRLNPYKCKQ